MGEGGGGGGGGLWGGGGVYRSCLGTAGWSGGVMFQGLPRRRGTASHMWGYHHQTAGQASERGAEAGKRDNDMEAEA